MVQCCVSMNHLNFLTTAQILNLNYQKAIQELCDLKMILFFNLKINLAKKSSFKFLFTPQWFITQSVNTVDTFI